MHKAFGMLASLLPLLGGCGQLFGTVVEMPRDSAATMLYNMGSAANLMDMPLGLSGTRMAVARSSDGVVWTYSRYGKPTCTFTAHVSEESAETSLVWSEVDEIGHEGEDYLCAAVGVIGKESVAATLEGRAADTIGAQREIAALAPAHLSSVFKGISDEMTRQTRSETSDCHELGTSAAQASCGGTRGLKDPTDRRD
ncbi:hypothetical protein [Novosphingobium sp.]|uniref:hypothetical protein n=1 Tax=Novosphingobium sp. TaxID=1874826 RepID=UPI00286CC68A|nr:hypothetical protein [Novosphingobium sp.]